MREVPEISIVLSAFNRLHYLVPAVDSVFAQTFTDWELIIADDGSAAVTRSYLRTLQEHPRVRIIWLEHIGRPGAVRNAALREARGEWIAFMDSDDLWTPGKLARQIASLRSAPECGWSFTSFVAVDGAGCRLPGERGRIWPVAKGWILEPLINGNLAIALPSVMVRRDLLLECGCFAPELRMCEDYDLWLRLAALSQADAVAEPLLRVRRHGEHSGSDAIAFEDRARVLQDMLDRGSHLPLHDSIHRERAKVAAGLACSHARFGHRREALRALLRSPADAWRYKEWWSGVLRSLLRTLVPAGVHALRRRGAL